MTEEEQGKIPPQLRELILSIQRESFGQTSWANHLGNVQIFRAFSLKAKGSDCQRGPDSCPSSDYPVSSKTGHGPRTYLQYCLAEDFRDRTNEADQKPNRRMTLVIRNAMRLRSPTSHRQSIKWVHKQSSRRCAMESRHGPISPSTDFNGQFTSRELVIVDRSRGALLFRTNRGKLRASRALFHPSVLQLVNTLLCQPTDCLLPHFHSYEKD